MNPCPCEYYGEQLMKCELIKIGEVNPYGKI